jgi:putative FmdB family regulatory protein
MPIYEYQCGPCAVDFERMVKMDAPIPACPQCSGDQVTKLVSAGSFSLKGDGWYRDHYGLRPNSEATDG